MNIWYSNLYKISIFIGILLYVTQLFLSGSNKTNALIAGHVNISLGLFLLIVLLMNQVTNKYLIASITVLFSLIAQLLYMTIAKKDRISSGHVSSGFGAFNTISLILVLLELFIMYMDPKFETLFDVSLKTLSMMTFMSLLIVTSNWIVYTVLYSYITDG
jgi:hypothetical protein